MAPLQEYLHDRMEVHGDKVSLRPGESNEKSDTPNGMFGPYGGLDMEWMLEPGNINKRRRPPGVLQVQPLPLTRIDHDDILVTNWYSLGRPAVYGIGKADSSFD